MSEQQSLFIIARKKNASQKAAEDKTMSEIFPGFKRLNLIDQMKMKNQYLNKK